MGDAIALRKLDSWHDEDAKPMAERHHRELEDSVGVDELGWTPEEMFNYNEKMHKIISNYNEDTYASQYSTPLPKGNSKSTLRVAARLAKEIERRIKENGRVTPESSDDDEIFEAKRKLKANQQLDQLWQLNQLKKLLSNAQRKNRDDDSQVSHKLSFGNNLKLDCGPNGNDKNTRNKGNNVKNDIKNSNDNGYANNSFNINALIHSLAKANILPQQSTKQQKGSSATAATKSNPLKSFSRQTPITTQLPNSPKNSTCSSQLAKHATASSLNTSNRLVKPLTGSSSRNILRSCLA